MKLDVSCFRYLTKEDFRVLEAIETGMKNHEYVSVELIGSLAKLRHGGIHRFLSNVLRYKLVAHSNQEYNGYRLSYLGYDILAIHALMLRSVISSIGSQIGVGKESDIFEAQDDSGNDIVIKIHRLGRTSFRSVRRNRDYMVGRSKASWLYMSRLAAVKEFSFMKALFAHDFPTPVPIDQNRHVVVMSRIQGFPLAQVKSGNIEYPDVLYRSCSSILQRLAEHGLIHGDFNEFNLIVDNDMNVTLIDFPQMISTDHPNAEEYFNRDLQGLVKFFRMKAYYNPPEELLPSFSKISSQERVVKDTIYSHALMTKTEEDDLAAFLSFKDGLQNTSIVADDEIGLELDDLNDTAMTGLKSSALETEIVQDSSSSDEDSGDLEEDSPDDASEPVDNSNPKVYLENTLQEEVAERAKRAAQSKFKEQGQKSRNMTKSRNKYGKIDRNFRNFDASY